MNRIFAHTHLILKQGNAAGGEMEIENFTKQLELQDIKAQ